MSTALVSFAREKKQRIARGVPHGVPLASRLETGRAARDGRAAHVGESDRALGARVRSAAESPGSLQ